MQNRRHISSNLNRYIGIVVKTPSWLLGKYIEQEWNISPGMNKNVTGKVLFIKNSKRGAKLFIPYWTVEETEDDGEDEYITLVQFVTDVIHKDLVVLVLSVYYLCAFIFLIHLTDLMYSKRTTMSFRSFITWGNFIFNLFETFKRTSKI